MIPTLMLPLAAAAEPLQAGRPLFGNLGLALAAISAAIATFVVLVALLGRWLAATHPAPAPVPVAVANVGAPAPTFRTATDVAEGVPAEIVPVVLAAVADLFGAQARVASIRPAPPAAPVRMPSIEALMQEWSHEGRRQIYSSHKVR